MSRNDLAQNTNRIQESDRILIALGILATELGAFALLPNDTWGIAKGPIFIAGSLCFLYVLTTGASLKYKSSGQIADYMFTERFRQWCFDKSIDTYGYSLVVVMGFGIAWLLGWNGGNNRHAALTFGVAFSIACALAVAIALWGLLVKRKEDE